MRSLSLVVGSKLGTTKTERAGTLPAFICGSWFVIAPFLEQALLAVPPGAGVGHLHRNEVRAYLRL